MSNTQTYKPNFAVHSGETLLENLEYLKISQVELSERTGLTAKHISHIIKGKASITPETALKLEKVLGIKAGFWNSLEKNYQANIARIEARRKAEDEAKKYITAEIKETYKALAEIGYIEKIRLTKKNYPKMILVLQKFYGFVSLDYIDDFNLKAAFRKYNRKNINQYSIAAWLRIGQLEAQTTEVADFDAQKLKDSLGNIKALSVNSSDKYLPQIENILADAGVVLVCAPLLKNSHAQGATQWVGKNKAYIILKTTNQGEDKFWFNLFHEIGHILKHSKKETFIDIDGGTETIQQEEKEADDFAQKTLIPNFNEDISGYTDYRIAIPAIAKKYSISQSMVAGRLAYECKSDKRAWVLTKRFIKPINYTNIKNN